MQSVNPESSFLESLPFSQSKLSNIICSGIFAWICLISGCNVLFEVPYQVENAHWLKSTEEMKSKLNIGNSFQFGEERPHQSELSAQGKTKLHKSSTDIEMTSFQY